MTSADDVRFESYDGTELCATVLGSGPTLVCLPGGPGRAVEYLGDLGGLAATRRLVLLDPRGVGRSADPVDPKTFRVDRLVDDVDALRIRLGLDRMDLLAHSAGAVLGALYAAAHPDRVTHLALITPGLNAIGVESTHEQMYAAMARRADEPWYPEARAALERIVAGERSLDVYRESRPLYYGHWNETAQAHAMLGVAERHGAAREGYFADAAIDPTETKNAITAPVLLYAGELDPLVSPALVREAAPLLANATVVVQPEAGHFPWLDDPVAFTTAVSSFLG